MKKILLYVWQLPQHLLGLALIWLLKAEKRAWQERNNNGVIRRNIRFWQFEPKGRFSRFVSGVSLGDYIILKTKNETAVKHEYGHSVQSRAWGPLYLLAVGLPSALGNNLWDRLMHKKWSTERRQKWYYNRYPEKQADRLGGAIREREG